MQQILKPVSLANQLGIQDLQELGSVQYGKRGDRGYVIMGGNAYETKIGSMRSVSGVSASEFSSISGTRTIKVDQSNLEFESVSGTATQIALPSDLFLSTASSDQVDVHTRQLAEFLDQMSNVFDSVSASIQPAYAEYQGRDLKIRDAHSKYDIVIQAGDRVSLTWIKDDGYVLRLQGTSTKYYIFGHKLAQSIISRTNIGNKVGAVADNDVNEYRYIGTVSQDIAQPIRIQRGTNLYSSRHRVFMSYNLKVSINEMVPEAQMERILGRTDYMTGNSDIIKGQSLAAIPVARQVEEEIWMCAVPVTSANRNFYQLYFAESSQRIQVMAQEHIMNNRAPTDYLMARSTNLDSWYKDFAAGRTVVRTRQEIDEHYNFKLIEAGSPIPLSKIIVTEPLSNPPAPSVPYTQDYLPRLLIQVRQMIDQGYFITGLMQCAEQEPDSITFSSSFFDQSKLNLVVMAADRIRAWLVSNGASAAGRGQIRVQPFGGEGWQGGARIVFKAPVGKDKQSLNLMQQMPPVIGARYQVKAPNSPSVYVTAHTAYTSTGEVYGIISGTDQGDYFPYKYMTLIV